jgi:cyclopropane fatty-acyl-phospholipid synthase-like methyltransferase
MTRHLGGWKSTRELIELCQIDRGKYILDIGCGIGKTACYIAKRLGCRVIGVDVSEKMIEWSKQRAKGEGVADRVEFRVVDAQSLPFEDRLFDAVISESVLAFVPDRQRALSEYVRVTRPGGYVGLNESTWLKTPLPTEVAELFSGGIFAGASLETADAWKELLAGSGVKDVVVRIHTLTNRRDLMDRMQWFGLRGILGNAYRIVSFARSSPANRKAVKTIMSMQLNIPKNLYDYYGYGMYVGRK